MQQQVMVMVTEIDIQRKRIALSMKEEAILPIQKAKPINIVVNKNGKKIIPENDYIAQLEALREKFK